MVLFQRIVIVGYHEQNWVMVTYPKPKQPRYLIVNEKYDGCVPQDPCSADSSSQAYKSMVWYHDFLDWPHGYRRWEWSWLCTARSMQCWFIITSIQIYGTVSRLLRLTAWISKKGKIMVVYCKIHAALVHYHKHTKLWSCSLRPKKCWSMITGVWRPWPSSPRPTRCRHIIVNYLYWWYEIVSLTLDGRVAWDPHIAGTWL